MSPRAPQVDRAQAARLLGVCRARRRRAVDLLIEHLDELGNEGLEDLLSSGPTRALGAWRELFLSGGAPLEVLVEAKELSKVDSDRGRRGELERLAGYFTAVAAALAFHGRRICSRPLGDVRLVLVDLASVTTGSWSELFIAAAGNDER